jgi:hypothetical protein
VWLIDARLIGVLAGPCFWVDEAQYTPIDLE